MLPRHSENYFQSDKLLFMKTNFLYAVAGLGLALVLPSSQARSQLAPIPADPAAVLQTMQKNNDDLLNPQETTLKDLADLTEAARQVRIYSKRG